MTVTPTMATEQRRLEPYDSALWTGRTPKPPRRQIKTFRIIIDLMPVEKEEPAE